MNSNTSPYLTVSQIKFFQENGYLVVRDIVLRTEIRQLSEQYDQLFQIAERIKNGDFFNLCGVDVDQGNDRVLQLMHCSRYIPNMLAGKFFNDCLHIAQQLLGETCQFKQDFAVCKPPLSQGITPWHQDNSYLRNDYDYNSVNMWIPLQAVNQDNGCMRFIPHDIHTQKIYSHYRINHDARIEGLQCDVDDAQAIACPLEIGDLVIHYVKTLHSTGPNTTTLPRKAYILEFETPPQKRSEPHDFPWRYDRKTQRVNQYRSLSARVENTIYHLSRILSSWKRKYFS